MQKEQADGDYQNLVFSVMVERDCDLQTAIDVSTDMMRTCVEEYLGYKAELPDKVDAEVAKYVQGLEHYVQGCIVWNYHSPRKCVLLGDGGGHADSRCAYRLLPWLGRVWQGGSRSPRSQGQICRGHRVARVHGEPPDPCLNDLLLDLG